MAAQRDGGGRAGLGYEAGGAQGGDTLAVFHAHAGHLHLRALGQLEGCSAEHGEHQRVGGFGDAGGKRAAIGLAHAGAVGVGGDHLEGVAGGHEAVEHAASDVQGAVAAATQLLVGADAHGADVGLVGGEELRLADHGVQGRGVLVAGQRRGKRCEVAQLVGAEGRQQVVPAASRIRGDHRASRPHSARPGTLGPGEGLRFAGGAAAATAASRASRMPALCSSHQSIRKCQPSE